MISHGDAVTWLQTLADCSVDCVVTDPPYESLEKHRARGTTTRLSHSKSSSNDWFHVFPNARFPELLAELFRVLKVGAHCYLFCDPETSFVLKPLADAAGFKFWNALIWDKRRIGMGYHYRRSHDVILFLAKETKSGKGKRRLHDLGIGDVLGFQPVVRGYPTEKPVGLAKVLIEQSTEPGELVVDPFCGSGAFGQAALDLGRRFFGCDISEAATVHAVARIKALAAPWGGV